jgi:hypothetical protein
MSRNQSRQPRRQVAFYDVEVGAADATGADSEQNVTGLYGGFGYLLD